MDIVKARKAVELNDSIGQDKRKLGELNLFRSCLFQKDHEWYSVSLGFRGNSIGVYPIGESDQLLTALLSAEEKRIKADIQQKEAEILAL